MRILERCLCALSLHDWHEEIKGIQRQGHVFPTHQRSCKRCGKFETLTYDPDLEDVIWDKPIKKANAKKSQ